MLPTRLWRRLKSRTGIRASWALKTMLSSVEANEHLGALPTSDYFRALRELRLSENDLRMLRANYSAPHSTVTAKQMAELLGYKSFGASNIHYGKLGRRVASSLGVNLKYPVLSLITMGWPNSECEWTLRPQVSEALERLGLADINEQTDLTSDEQRWLREGKVSRIITNAHERNPVARRLCIAHYGTSCSICNFSFGDVYGNDFSNFVHVHHLTELAAIGEEYTIDPIKDLRPVCPNCHAIIHQRKPAYSIQEVKAFMSRNSQLNRVS